MASRKQACALATLRASASAGAALRVLAPPFRPLQKRQPLVWRAGYRSPLLCPARSGGRKGDKNMTEEIKVQQTAEEATSAVPAGHQASTVGTRHGAERNDRKPTDAWTALLELLGSKKIPPLDAVQMLALLHYLYNEADRPLRFQKIGR